MTASPRPVTVPGLVGLESELLERVDAAVLVVDLEGRILYANRYVENLYGWSPDEVVGKRSSELSDVAIGDQQAAEIGEALRTHGSWEGTFDVRRLDGSRVSV